MTGRKWAIGIVGLILGLLVGAGIGAAAGGSNKTTTTTIASTITAASPKTRTVTRTVPHIIVHVHTITTTVPAHTDEPSASSANAGHYSGNGSENLGTITVSQPSTLKWSCSGCLVFAIDGSTPDYSATIGVDSEHHSSGVTAVEPGTYHSVNVTADEGETNEGWTITITPG